MSTERSEIQVDNPPQDQCSAWAYSTLKHHITSHSLTTNQTKLQSPSSLSIAALPPKKPHHTMLHYQSKLMSFSPLCPEISAVRCGQSATAAMIAERDISAVSSVDQASGLCTEGRCDSPSMDHATDLLLSTGRDCGFNLVSQSMQQELREYLRF